MAVAGAAQVCFGYLPEPDTVYDHVVRQMDELRQQESPPKQIDVEKVEWVGRQYLHPQFPRLAARSGTGSLAVSINIRTSRCSPMRNRRQTNSHPGQPVQSQPSPV